MTPELIERINQLARLAKERPLTPSEEAERAQLRRQYIERFRACTRATLENTVVQYPDGSRVPLREAKPPEK
jgi:uncharacterized protein YnzC (UPF0291/DUF896 family)